MLAEWIRHALIRCPPALKEAGVLYDLIALESRARRLRHVWKPHQERCRALVREWVEQTPGRDRVVVLGSGLLLETPVVWLAEQYRQVVLVDLFHMPGVRRQARSWPNVTLTAMDLTGCLEGLGDVAQGGSLPVPAATLPVAEGADLIISANCLSQLSLRPAVVAWHGGALIPDLIRAWEAAIVRSHVQALSEQAGAVGLICDRFRIGTDRDTGQVRERYDLLHGADLPPFAGPVAEWDWLVAPAPEEQRRVSYHHTMIGGLLKGRT